MIFYTWEQRAHLFFLLVLPQEDEKQSFFFFTFLLETLWMVKFDHPLFIHFKFFWDNFFLGVTHIHVIINSQKFPRKWSAMTYCSKSANTCNFEGYPKLETSIFQWWQFFISYPNVNLFIFLKMSNLKPFFSSFTNLNFPKLDILFEI
jgi:hypothetical protein